MNPRQLYDAGRLNDAIAVLSQELRSHPLDAARRGFLAELLCFAGLWERADTQLDTLGHQDPEAMVGVSLFRQLVRAAQAREQFFAEGRLPEFLDPPTSPAIRLYLEASIHLREGRSARAGDLLGEAENQRQRLSGTCNGRPFDDFRDLDDLTACVFEVLTSTGKYYWIPFERVERIEFRAPVRSRDLLWRQVHMMVSDGPEGDVFLPVTYPMAGEADETLLLGRATDWRGGDGAPVRGVGQRTCLVGDEALGILEMEKLEILTAADDPAAPGSDG